MDEYLNEMDNELEHTDVYLEENDLMAKHVKASKKAIARVCPKSIFKKSQFNDTHYLPIFVLF